MLVLGCIVFQKESSNFLKLGVAFLTSVAKFNTILISEVIDFLATGTAVLAVSFLTGVTLGHSLGSQIEEDLLRDKSVASLEFLDGLRMREDEGQLPAGLISFEELEVFGFESTQHFKDVGNPQVAKIFVVFSYIFGNG